MTITFRGCHGGRCGTWVIEVRDTGLVVGTIMVKPLPGVDEATLTSDIEVGWHPHPATCFRVSQLRIRTGQHG